MNRKDVLILGVALLAVTVLLLVNGGDVIAQGPLPPKGPHSPSSKSPEAAASNVNADGAFTYQGQLKFNNALYNGTCDFSFGIYDAATSGTQVAGPYYATNLTVSNGLFSAPINYWNWGSQRWIQIGVSCPHSASPVYTPLDPRQKITAAPYANSLRPGSLTTSLDSAGNTLTSVYISDYSYAGIDAYAYYTGTPGLLGYTGANANTPGVQGTSGSIGTGNNNTGVLGLDSKGTLAMAHPSGGFYDAGGTFSGPNGVIGAASTDANDGYGVTGITTGTNGIGVYGYSMSTTGTNYGVEGYTTSPSGAGVYGQAPGSAGSKAILGVNTHTSSTDSTYAIKGVYGGGSGYNYNDSVAVLGDSNARGVLGYGPTVYGVAGISTNGWGIYGLSTGSGYAGYFNGNVQVNGNLSATGTKPFKIDNPVDPANQYLYHYAVESPQVENVYNGTATLDAKGEAVITLPSYFSAVNTGDYRYYLTAIGAPMPNLYVAQEIQGNTFKVAGGAAGKKVSWMVYGQRNDPWVRDNPQPDVVAKPADEKGTYLYPQGYGLPETSGYDYNHLHPKSATAPVLPSPVAPTQGR